jgi:hypothetical protein
VVDDRLELVPPERLGTNCVRSPDDLDAVYRNKRRKTCRGPVINVSETCHPDNALNLITDITVNPANKDESEVLADRLEWLNEKTPDPEELHMDGSYGSERTDGLMPEHGMTPTPALGGHRPPYT